VKSGVFCRSSSMLLRTKAKVASSLTDVWQLLFEQQDITVICTIHFHSWLHENQCNRAWRHQLLKPTRRNVYQKPVSDVNELKQHLIETWSATSRASFIKRLIRDEIVLMRSQSQKQTLNICYNASPKLSLFVNAVMNKLTYVSFHKVR